MDISLTPDLEQLIAQKVSSGRYGSATEVLREALRLLQSRDDADEARLEELRCEIAVGLEEADGGELAPLDVEAIKSEGRRQLAAKPGKT